MKADHKHPGRIGVLSLCGRRLRIGNPTKIDQSVVTLRHFELRVEEGQGGGGWGGGRCAGSLERDPLTLGPVKYCIECSGLSPHCQGSRSKQDLSNLVDEGVSKAGPQLKSDAAKKGCGPYLELKLYPTARGANCPYRRADLPCPSLRLSLGSDSSVSLSCLQCLR